MEVLEEKPVPVPICLAPIHMIWPGIELGPEPLHGPFTASWAKTPQYELNLTRRGMSLMLGAQN